MVDTRPLGRRPGSMRTEQRIVPNPGALAVGMTGVPENGEIELDLRLEAVMEGVLVTGRARTRMEGECARCLDPLAEQVEAEFQELFRYPLDDEIGGVAAGVEADAESEDEDYYLEGDLIDLEQVVRDAVVLALPLSPLCRDDCPGLCIECGAKLAEAGPDHGHDDRVDPRWEALRTLGEEPGGR
ncbi:YceD family protein [Marinitenerispora sediminis]|uniref:YceD family protein n=1 Tax=Marinitenerispora sediminis TaxID=1931232 RepID=UPI001F383256|nr:DUF177 domain-containing protein [Marinitenerispora sediminis]